MPSEASAQPVRECLNMVPRTKESGKILRLLKNAVSISKARPVTLDFSGAYGESFSDIAAQIPKAIQASDAVIVDLTGSDPKVI
jgi:hypothetical protein